MLPNREEKRPLMEFVLPMVDITTDAADGAGPVFPTVIRESRGDPVLASLLASRQPVSTPLIP